MNKKYPYTYVEFIPPGSVDIYFRKNNGDKCVTLAIGYDIIDPLLEKYKGGLDLWQIIDEQALCNCISTEFSGIPNNQKNMLAAYLGIDGKLYKVPGECSIESTWTYVNTPETPQPFRIKGLNSKSKTEEYITAINDKLNKAATNIKHYITSLIATLITEEDVTNLNK